MRVKGRIWIDDHWVSIDILQNYINEQRQFARDAGAEAIAKEWMKSIHSYEDKINSLKKELANTRRLYSRIKNKMKRIEEDSDIKLEQE